VLGRVATITRMLAEDPRELNVCYISSPAPWRTSRTTERARIVVTPRGWQRGALDRIIRAYSADQRASVLVSGKPNAGKSKLGELVAAHMH